MFRFHNYSPFEKVCCWVEPQRYCLTSVSRESVRFWVYRLGQLFTSERKCMRLVAVDETVEQAYRNKVERWFRKLKDRTKRFYNNINLKTVESIGEIATAIAP
ncbi:MAG: hypothetical protein QXH12_05790 [Candidatus Caldarchaeum sp.]